jgi:hypothetical protein
VVRTSTGVTSFSGTCINLEPNFGAQFNGQNSYVNAGAGDNSGLDLIGSLTISLWINAGYAAGEIPISKATGSNTGKYFMLSGTWPTLNWQIFTGGGTSEAVAGTSTLNLGQWYHLVYTYDGTYGRSYVNGALYSTSSSYVRSAPYPSDTGVNLYIGQRCSPTCGSNFNGIISNVQIYNTSLSSNSIQALYMEGIGGAPINLRNLVGWWPLNDNANDYSGNGNNGAAANVFYTADWTNGYIQP